MRLGDKLKFIVTGKRPETSKAEELEPETNSNSSQGKTEKVNPFEEHAEDNHIEKNDDDLIEKDDESKETQFTAKTGMTLQKAESLISKWEKNEEFSKCKKGAELIVEFFPNHESKKFLDTKQNNEKSENKKKRSEREQNKSNHSLNLEHSKNVETNTAPLEPVSPENNDAQKTLESSDEKEKTTTSQASWGRKKRRGKKRL